jgi:tryptophan synthase alpha chain
MSTLLEIHLKKTIANKGYAFVPYLAAGDPDWVASKRLIAALIASGADTIEIGLPFTDPVADGPVLQRAFKRVLSHEKASKFSIERFFSFLSDLNKAHPNFPFLVMGYANIFYHMGFHKILTLLIKHNVVGVIIPDVPYEEKARLVTRENLEPLLKKISWIDFITPTTTPDRLSKICRQASGFLYFVSTKGVTGQGQNDFSLKPWKKIISEVRKRTKVPILTGFGIRSAAHALEAIEATDGFIIGSRIHEIIEQNLDIVSVLENRLKDEMKKIIP